MAAHSFRALAKLKLKNCQIGSAKPPIYNSMASSTQKLML